MPYDLYLIRLLSKAGKTIQSFGICPKNMAQFLIIKKIQKCGGYQKRVIS